MHAGSVKLWEEQAAGGVQAAAPLELTLRLHPLAAAVERWTCEDE